MRSYKVHNYVPLDLSIEKLLREYPPAQINKFSQDKLIAIISLIIEWPAYYERYEDQYGFTVIHSSRFQRIAPNYTQYLKYLFEADVIEIDNHYIVDEKPRGYRLTEKYSEGIRPEQVNCLALIKKHKKEHKISDQAEKQYPYLTKWFNSNLTIDYPEAMDYLDANKSELFKDKKNPQAAYRRAYIGIDNFHYPYYYASVDDNVHRFHSSLTCLNKSFRPYVKYNGETLVGVDISNSQPLCSTLLLNPDFYNSITTGLEKTKENHEQKRRTSGTTILPNQYPTNIPNTNPKRISQPTITTTTTPMLLKYVHNIDNEDIKLYNKLVESGQLYEHYAILLRDEMGISNATRDIAKEQFMKSIYSSNKFFGQTDTTTTTYYIGTRDAMPKRIFARNFPNVYGIFSLYKSNDKSALSCFLQRIESHNILDIICKRIAMERPKLPIFTIHDSVITTKGNEEYVKAIMEEELTKIIGFTPSLKIEYWSNID